MAVLRIYLSPDELMLGDWVNFLIDIEGGDTEYDPVNEIYQPMQIVSITAWGNNDGEVESLAGVINDIDQVKPIPLTPEILEKNGFIKQAFDGWKLRTENYSIMWRTDYGEPNLIIDSWSADYGKFNKFGISFVHELQHALRLCGIEKQIEL